MDAPGRQTLLSLPIAALPEGGSCNSFFRESTRTFQAFMVACLQPAPYSVPPLKTQVNTSVLLGDCEDKVAKCHCCVACVALGLYLCCWMLAKRARKEASPVTLVAAVQSRSLTWRSLLPVEFAIGIVAVLAVAVANHLPEDCSQKAAGKTWWCCCCQSCHGVAGNSGVPSFS